MVAPCFWSWSRVRVRLFTCNKISQASDRSPYLCSVHLGKILEMMEILAFLIKSKLNFSDVAPACKVVMGCSVTTIINNPYYMHNK